MRWSMCAIGYINREEALHLAAPVALSILQSHLFLRSIHHQLKMPTTVIIGASRGIGVCIDLVFQAGHPPILQAVANAP
jgi:hypothetical protein